MTRKIEFPRIVMVGSGCLDRVGEVSKEIALGKGALVVTGPKTIKIAGNKVISILEDSGFDVSKNIVEVADSVTVEKTQKLIKKIKANIVLGVGGGTCIDIAKLSSFRENIPFISVPTAASHDGIGSPIASVKENDTLKSISATSPIAIIADTKVVITAPHKFLAAGCGDLVSNYTAVEDWKLAHRFRGELFGQYASALSVMSAEVILESAKLLSKNLEESIKIVLEGLISSGAAMCITGTSRPCSGAEHMFSHVLDKISPVHALHGEQCGVGTILMAYLHKLDWEHFRDSLKLIGAPVTAKELGIEKEYIIKALSTAHTVRDRYTVLGTGGLSEEAAEELARKTGVI